MRKLPWAAMVVGPLIALYVIGVVRLAWREADERLARRDRFRGLALRVLEPGASGAGRWIGHLEGPPGRVSPRGSPAAAYQATLEWTRKVRVMVRVRRDGGSE